MDIKGLQDILHGIDALTPQVRDALNRGVYRGTLKVWKEAALNAPRSPSSQQQARATRKTRRDTSGRLNPSATTRAKPGGLERSIAMSVNKDDLSGRVFVAANSEAGKYAGMIHDEKGESWHNRGYGTIAKGPRADEKFIERALKDNEDNVRRVIDHEIGKVKL